MLRQYADRLGLDRNFTIYDQTDRSKVVKMALEDAGIDNNRFTPDALAGAISKAKNQLLSPEKYAARANDFFGQVVARVYPIYEKRLRDANALDFDDLLYWPALALKHDAELRAELDAPLSLRPHRRVPGHQPGAIRHRPRPVASTTRTCASSATRTNRSTNFAARISVISSISSATSPTPAC